MPAKETVTNPHTAIGGKRPDLDNRYFRSRWEANWARYLNHLVWTGEIVKWEYEPEEFWFEAIKRGVRSYKPDFKVYAPDGTIVYHEVKGWMDATSRTKLKRMAKYHPTIPIHVIGKDLYRSVAATYQHTLPAWEADPMPAPKKPRAKQLTLSES